MGNAWSREEMRASRAPAKGRTRSANRTDSSLGELGLKDRSDARPFSSPRCRMRDGNWRAKPRLLDELAAPGRFHRGQTFRRLRASKSFGPEDGPAFVPRR